MAAADAGCDGICDTKTSHTHPSSSGSLCWDAPCISAGAVLGCVAAEPGAMLRHWYEEEGGAAGGGEAQRVLVVETPPQPTRANITLSFS